MEASVNTGADLHRFTHNPWCPKCGTWAHDVHTDADPDIRATYCGCGTLIQPGLWIRFPNVRPEGLKWSEKGEDVHGGYYPDAWCIGDNKPISTGMASREILGGIVEGVNAKGLCLTIGDGILSIADRKGKTFLASAPTITEAACIALHKWGDAKEQV